MTPRISVLMPVYNCQQFVAAAVNSILHQTFTDFELIIIDDASTDSTCQVVTAIQDDRIKLIRKETNSGYTHSLNLGLEIAKGEYIARMDGDDISKAERFAEQVQYLDSNPNAILCGSWFRLMSDNRIINHPTQPEEIKVTLMDYCAIGHPTVMMRKAKLKELGYAYNPELEPAEDYDLWTRLVAHGDLGNIGKVLLDYRVHSGQVSKTKEQIQLKHTRLSQLTMLRYIMPQAGEDDEILHMRFIEGTGISSYEDLQYVMSWGKRLIHANQAVGFYNTNHLENLVREKERMLTRRFFNERNKFNPTTLSLVFKLKQQVKGALSMKDTAKLFVKSVIFWRRKVHE